MTAIKLVVVLGLGAIAYSLPINEQQGQTLITGVFIPADAFKNLQDRANVNSPNNQQPMQGNNPVHIPLVNTIQPQYQPLSTNQPQYQPTLMTSLQQPRSNLPTIVYTQQPLTANRDPNQPIIVMSNQPNNQPDQPIVLVQQPLQSPNQPIYVQPPNQQPIQVLFTSNGHQMPGTLVQSPIQNQPGSTVYTLIPLNGPNNNMNTNSGGSYVIPVQPGH